MALVNLPCDLPWWSTLQSQLTNLLDIRKTDPLIEGMISIHAMCCVGLDPDEPDVPDNTLFEGLRQFIEDLNDSERDCFFNVTLPKMLEFALNLRNYKPMDGLKFILQQQADEIEVSRKFVYSLVAHAFFSTFPKRTQKSHPTLQDFNFSIFFKHLNQKFQKAKLKSILHYFNLFDANQGNPPLKITRRVMSGREWLTIDDWMECSLPLCPLNVKHEGRIESVGNADAMVVCFSSKKIGGKALADGSSRECVQFAICPELLVTLLCVEALEDNEILVVEGAAQVGKINNPRQKGIFEPFREPRLKKICCMDAENYSRLPLSQYEEDNILRELNKALLGFRKGKQQLLHKALPPKKVVSRRLSPIGESFSSTPTDGARKPVNINFGTHLVRNKFIMLGSSKELLPVTRSAASAYSSCQSESPEEFHTAPESLSDEEDKDMAEANARRYSGQLDTLEGRHSFAERLKEALSRAQSSATSNSSSYAVDISVSGSSIGDTEIRMKRGGSRGFMLDNDSIDMEAYEKFAFGGCVEELANSVHTLNEEMNERRNRGGSSKYSFSTDYNSDLDDVYEQLSQWLDECDTGDDLEYQREEAIVRFASHLLKRTMSESLAGVMDEEERECADSQVCKSSSKIMARSLSLEISKYKEELTAHLLSTVKRRPDDDASIVVTGNWGCGSRFLGDPQLKLLIQWLAASVADIPTLYYYTCSHRKLLKLDTIRRVLLDRGWSVGELVQALLHFCKNIFTSEADDENENLFESLINSSEHFRNVVKSSG